MLIYGFFCGGDPRKFEPDREYCLPHEIAAHKEACARWNAGHYDDHTPLHIPGTQDVDDYEAPEIDPVSLIASDRFDLIDFFCRCFRAHTSDPDAHAETCLYRERLAEVEHLKGAPLP